MSKSKKHVIVGIDEAGRGPLAGPVAVGICAIKDKPILKHFQDAKDSKQLSEKKREEIYERIMALNKKVNIDFGLRNNNISLTNDGKMISNRYKVNKIRIYFIVQFCNAKTIDKYGIVYAIDSAMKKGLKKLLDRKIIDHKTEILLDGSLKAPEKFVNQKTIIKGDARVKLISLASICAKVERDRLMKKMAKRYSQYGFEVHKGYGTKSHYEAIKKIGICEIHRRSFLGNFMKMKSISQSINFNN